jgi:acetoin utilization deacetylase AcuC-like enzyme
VAIIDLDVHQGDGTAQILAGDTAIFTLSLHGATNFPFRKQVSCLDIGLPDGTGDADYLAELDAALRELRRRFEPQFILYLAGADPTRTIVLKTEACSTASDAATADSNSLSYCAYRLQRRWPADMGGISKRWSPSTANGALGQSWQRRRVAVGEREVRSA